MAKPNDLQKAAEMVWSALDKLSEENPEEYKSFVDQQLKQGAEMMSPPQPAQCMSVSVVHKGKEKRLFLNICKWLKIPSPETDSDPIPVKGGVLRHVVVDHRRTPDLLYDVAVSPKVMEECSQQPMLLSMLHSLILDFVTDMLAVRVNDSSLSHVGKFKGTVSDIQHSLEGNEHLISQESRLDMRESILEELSKMTVSQTLNDAKLPPLLLAKPKQNIQKNLIEELPDKKEKKTKKKIVKFKESMKYSLIRTEKGLQITVCLPPGVKTVADIDLDISEDDVVLTVGEGDKLSIDLPELVNPEGVQAKLYTPKSELIISLPFT